jgi:hypothetical protein
VRPRAIVALLAGAIGAGAGAVWAGKVLRRPSDAGAGVTPAVAPDPLAPLSAFEAERRAAADFSRLPASDRSFGPDPTAIRALPAGRGAARFVGILRGRNALVLLDSTLTELARVSTPPSPTGLAVGSNGDIFVSGEQANEIARYRAEERGPGGALVRTGSTIVHGASGLRDVAIAGDVLYAVDERAGQLFVLNTKTFKDVGATGSAKGPGGAIEAKGAGVLRVLRPGHGAFRVARVGERVIVDCLLEHALVLYRVDARGLPLERGAIIIRHDGPIWGFDAVTVEGDLFVAAGGVEDHPLDRSGGSFGFVDSFAFLYKLAAGAERAERLAAINVSSEGVITPKALLLRRRGDSLVATVAGYGGDRVLEIDWGPEVGAAPALAARAAPPGIAMLTATEGGGAVFADPLFDVWGRLAPEANEPPGLAAPPEPTPAPPRSAAAKVGEALFFTKLMAPWNSSAGPLSRFTCETCHFEGYVDGRIHHTGRDDVRVSTKPLLGLFNNRPHFSRALDPDLTAVADNEFRVAGALSGHDPWFAAPVDELPWVAALGATVSELGPIELRQALMTFLMDFSHRPNPAALARRAFTGLEREGAAAFRRRCEGCHRARLASDVASSQVPFEGWEARVLSREGPIVWGRSGYEKTGVTPYVHEQGARVPSLRRLYKKWPYLTNGSATELGQVLEWARFGGTEEAPVFYHRGAPPEAGLAALDEGEREAILAFLALL